MTAPAGVTIPYSITPGIAPRPITDGGNVPQGLTLINRGDNGGTVWVQPGPSGAASAVPLQPAATLTWSDPTTLPYAFVLAGGTTETLIVSNQIPDYNNPVAVAVATATQIAASTLARDTATQIAASALAQNTAAATATQIAASTLAADTAAHVAASTLAADTATLIAASNLAVNTAQQTASQITASTLAADTAAHTASQLAAGGVPTTTKRGNLWAGRLVKSSGTPPLDVSAYASVLVKARYAQPSSQAASTPTGPVCLGFRQYDAANPYNPNAAGQLPDQWDYLGVDSSIDTQGTPVAVQLAWLIPVTAPTLQISNDPDRNANGTAVDVQVIGSTHPAPGDRITQVGNDTSGARTLAAALTVTAGTKYNLVAVNNGPAGAAQGAPTIPTTRLTTLNGPVQVNWFVSSGAGTVLANYVDEAGGLVAVRFRVGGTSVTDGSFTWNHPRVPVSWTYTPDTSVAGNAVRIHVAQA